jgi:hypothetical protein
MTEYVPLTKEEREEVAARIARMYCAAYQTETHGSLALAIRRYAATVAALEAELDACRKGSAAWEDSARYESKMRADAEAEVKRLTPLAEVGEAVEGMGVHDTLRRTREDTWTMYTNAQFNATYDRTEDGPTPVAAMRAAKGSQ